ncbi:hypothetical protein DBR39_07990 [Chryseobacterium sp. KBW03]|uniref:hypothetical protein n=1 Tax=Chryseobacterium sp. KBW03 TaxID=2153362 RepID=UPI000F59C810|nr:hypothetical protein [Chryseobacterium sp. KBW03]RQO40865.1 hypothetical protein DBR39_07990 [Chryseobacterium sp. KBW03]
MKNLIVYLMMSVLIVSCSSKKEYEAVNENASLPESFDFNAMNLKVVTSSINHKKQAMTTLYGNIPAIDELKGNAGKEEHTERILTLITWSQKEDPYWYGAKIPDHLLSVEVIKSRQPFSDHSEISYQRYEGKDLKKVDASGTERIHTILSMKPSIMP